MIKLSKILSEFFLICILCESETQLNIREYTGASRWCLVRKLWNTVSPNFFVLRASDRVHTRKTYNYYGQYKVPFTQSIKTIPKRLSVVLGFLFSIVSLSNGGTVGGVLGAVHDFISQTFGDGLHALESGLSGTDGHEVDGEVSSL